MTVTRITAWEFFSSLRNKSLYFSKEILYFRTGPLYLMHVPDDRYVRTEDMEFLWIRSFTTPG